MPGQSGLWDRWYCGAEARSTPLSCFWKVVSLSPTSKEGRGLLSPGGRIFVSPTVPVRNNRTRMQMQDGERDGPGFARGCMSMSVYLGMYNIGHELSKQAHVRSRFYI